MHTVIVPSVIDGTVRLHWISLLWKIRLIVDAHCVNELRAIAISGGSGAMGSLRAIVVIVSVRDMI
jgi:hypothetical protein